MSNKRIVSQQTTNSKLSDPPDSLPAKRKSDQGVNSPSAYSGEVEKITFLQGTLGNGVVSRLVQAKLTVGHPGDKYEQEADQVAEHVMRMPAPSIQRTVEGKHSDHNTHSPFQSTVTAGSRLGDGQSLPESERAFFEPRFGQSFEQVRVHAGTDAAETAQTLQAKAFTIGQDVVFGAGQYAPGTPEGRKLLAHELTHTIQQKGDSSQTSEGVTPVQQTSHQIVQGSFLGDVWDGVTDVASSAWDGVTDVAGSVWDGVTNVAGSVWDGVTSAGSAIWSGLKSVGAWSWGVAQAIGKWGWNVLQSAGEWVWDLITEAPTRIWRLLKHVGSGIVGYYTWLWDGIKGGLGHLWSGLQGIFSWLGEGVSGLFNWVWTGLQGGANWAWRLLHGDFSGFWDGIGEFFSWLGEGVTGLAKWGWEGLEGAARWAWSGVKGVARWLWDGIVSGAAWAGRLIAKLLDLIGFGEIMDLLWQIIKFNSRQLTGTEIAEAQRVFGNSIDYSQVRIDEASLIAWIASKFNGGDTGVTTFHTINFPRKISTAPGNGDMGWLIHELTHVSQMEHVGMQYMGEAIHAQATAGYNYGGEAGLMAARAAGKHLRDFNREQQGDIAHDYYSRLTSGQSTAAYDPFIAELRAGNL